MQWRIILFTCIFFACTHIAGAQTFNRYDTVLNIAYNNFFQQNPGVRAISIDAEKKAFTGLTIFKHSNNYPSSQYFDLSFEGDKYLLRKTYGNILLPTRLLEHLSAGVCQQYLRTTIRAVPDSMSIHLQYYCPDKSSEWYFEKVPNEISFPGGIKKLEPLVQAALQQTVFKDSIFLLRAIVNPDKTINHFEVLEGADTSVTNRIIAALEKTVPWQPAIQGGRAVKAYVKLFVKVLPNSRIRLYVQNL